MEENQLNVETPALCGQQYLEVALNVEAKSVLLSNRWSYKTFLAFFFSSSKFDQTFNKIVVSFSKTVQNAQSVKILYLKIGVAILRSVEIPKFSA